MRILVVDDDPINRFLLLNMLEQQGYTDTYEAEDGAQAVELAKQIDPDLVLLDAIMPVMDGYEAAPLLKSLSGDIYLPIIFITAIEDEEALVHCLEVGGDDFVSKPFDKVILAAKIRAHARTRLLSKKSFEQNKRLKYYQASVEREHEIVEHIFNNALSIDVSLNPFIDYQLNPASTFNGDLFLMCPSPTGGIYFLMGDFTGHGLASSIGALPVSQGFNAMCKKGLSLMEIAETLNDQLLILLPDDMFFAAILVEIDQSGRRIDVWNGGMPHLFVQDSLGQIVKRFESRHMSLGILEKDEFEAMLERYEADYGDCLIGFSDGLPELENEEGEMLTEDGVERWLIENPKLSTQQIYDKALDYLGDGVRNDDVTLVKYRCQPLDKLELEHQVCKVPMTIFHELNAEDIKTTEPVELLVNIVANQLGMAHLHSSLFTVLSELYNNALDHGVLALDSSIKQSEDGFFDYFMHRQEKLQTLTEAKIDIKFEYKPKEKKLCFSITDSGRGFDPTKLDDVNNIEKSYGRGIALVKELSESVIYSNQGKTVDIVFKA